MSYAVWLVPVGLAMGLVGLVAFLWSMKSGQLDDLDGAAERVLLPGAGDRPLPDIGETEDQRGAGYGADISRNPVAANRERRNPS